MSDWKNVQYKNGKLRTNDGGSGSHNYSTTEQVIGTWIDGKPLYEKTIDFGYLPNADASTVQTGLSNIIARSINGHCYSASTGQSLPIPYANPSSGVWQITVYISNYGSSIGIRTGNDRTDMYAYVTIQYTKTTD